jgi:hypothetical protein
VIEGKLKNVRVLRFYVCCLCVTTQSRRVEATIVLRFVFTGLWGLKIFEETVSVNNGLL